MFVKIEVIVSQLLTQFLSWFNSNSSNADRGDEGFKLLHMYWPWVKVYSGQVALELKDGATISSIRWNICIQ